MSERRIEQLSATTGLIFAGLMLAAAAVGFWFPGVWVTLASVVMIQRAGTGGEKLPRP